jgi:uncharacterized membrane protein YphA (DoxX/SURF4 family)
LNTFLTVAGWLQILIALILILGIFTRFGALLVALMGLITIIIPGFIVLKDVPHFAYAFALTGAALTLMIERGAGLSVDQYIQRKADT